MAETITAEEYQQMTSTKGRSKYGNHKTEVDGITFDSAAEARRYDDLKKMRDAGLIESLELQFPLVFTINNKVMFKYLADFVYYDREKGETIYEDVKSEITRKKESYRLKKKIIEEAYRITITEVMR